MRPTGAGRVLRATALLAAGSLLLAACGGSADDDGATTVLTWHVTPDRVDAAALAQACSEGSDGRFRIEVQALPEDVDDRHAQLLRRLSAEDTSIDLLSLDSAFTAEFSAAQLLAPVPDDLQASLTQDVFPAALQAASDDGALVAAPWWFDPYLLWFRGAAAERAGLDTSEPILWDDLLAGAERLGVSVQIADPDGQGLPGWVNALVAGAGGTMLDGGGRDPQLGLDTEAGREAAAVVEYYAEAGLGPGPSDTAAADFAADAGSFLLAPSSVVTDPGLAGAASELQWVPYPVLGTESVAPLTGVHLAVPLFAPRPDLSYDAIACLTSAVSLQQLMLSSGHSAARSSTYDDEQVQAGYPLADVTRPAVESGVALPATPYWQRVRAALLDTWTPVTSVTTNGTPAASQRAVRDLVAGRLR